MYQLPLRALVAAPTNNIAALLILCTVTASGLSRVVRYLTAHSFAHIHGLHNSSPDAVLVILNRCISTLLPGFAVSLYPAAI